MNCRVAFRLAGIDLFPRLSYSRGPSEEQRFDQMDRTTSLQEAVTDLFFFSGSGSYVDVQIRTLFFGFEVIKQLHEFPPTQ